MKQLYQAEEFQYFKNPDNKFYIKFFLLNADKNINGWRVSDNAIKQYMADFKGKPFIIMPNFSHPHPENASDMFEVQKPYQKGSIIEVGFDANSQKAWAIAEITDKPAQELIRNGIIRYVSPSMLASDEDVTMHGSTPIIQKFQAAHVAGVANPAYGVMDAQIKGTCQAGAAECKKQLMMIQASVEAKNADEYPWDQCMKDQMEKYGDEETARKVCGEIKAQYGASSDDCVSNWIKELAATHPDWEQDQIVAIAHKKCQTEGNYSGSSFNNRSGTKNKMESQPQELLQADIAKMKSELSTLQEQVKTYSAQNEKLEKENISLKESFQAAERKPFVAAILESKKILGLTADKDEEKLMKLDIVDLKAMQAEYDTLAKTKSAPRDARLPANYSADSNHEDNRKASDAFLEKLHGRGY